MRKLSVALIALVLIVVVFLASTIVSPVLIVAEDSSEENGIDMAATIGLTGFEWIYPGSSVNAQGQTLHNVYADYPDDPYGAARDIMSYTYHFTPHIIVSVNNDGAAAIFGGDIIDNIRANDAYNGYAGNDKVSGSMDRGDAVGTAMAQNGMNIFEIPIQFLTGNISIHFV
ncbi:hypothetical protein [Methanobrevibacter sp.]|uniref:hypothetical protein n=1 Tax=Methanobrevibacter sp. TaxID=66852 RepID=UPI003D7E2B99